MKTTEIIYLLQETAQILVDASSDCGGEIKCELQSFAYE